MTNPNAAPARPSYFSIAPATSLLIFVNVAVYVWMGLRGVSWMQPSTGALFAFGGDLPLVTLTGEGWRLFTCMFLHAGLVHLGLNMYVLAFTGPRVEIEFGTPRMLAIYLAGGLLSSCASVWWGARHMLATDRFGQQVPHMAVSVGASGAVMALFGSLLALLLAPPPRAGAGALPAPMDRSLIQVVVINLGMGFAIPGVDQAAHVGGLVGGFAIGLVMAALPAARGTGAVLARFAATAALTPVTQG